MERAGEVSPESSSKRARWVAGLRLLAGLAAVSASALALRTLHSKSSSSSPPRHSIFDSGPIGERTARIINPYPIDYYPVSTVFIAIKKRNTGASSCTGSILSERVVLTAAHCFVGRKSKMDVIPDKNELRLLDSVTIHVGVKDKNLDDYNNRWIQYDARRHGADRAAQPQ